MAHIDDARQDLKRIFARDIDTERIRELKAKRLSELKNALLVEFEKAGANPNAWFRTPLNNARIASLSLYEGLLPQFRQILANCEEDLECFYTEARRLGEMSKDERAATLALLQIGFDDRQ